jgi:para-aminobenzoate synthetase/4-amino-4-deoxychorismate lyase
VLFEDALAPAESAASRLLSDCRGSASAASTADLPGFFAAVAAASAAGQIVALALDYELGAWFEPALDAAAGAGPVARAWFFASQQRLTAAEVANCLAGERAPAGVLDLRLTLDEAAYTTAIGRIQDYIAAGDCYQVNFTFPLCGRAYGSPAALYARLRQQQPTAHAALFCLPDGEAIVSLSPELFLERRGERLITRPMKGTAPRGTDAASDATSREALLASTKDRAENVMIVDLLRNDLGRVAVTGSVRVESLCTAEPYPTVWQLVSTVSATAASRDLGELLMALFPCGSITGAPKVRAMQIINELETAPRGSYCGSLGWLEPEALGGDFSLNVAIRTLHLTADGRAMLGVGSGIVADSMPAAEYAECRLKARFLTDLPADFRLIETLRLEDGHYPLLKGHLRRLGRSLAALGWGKCDQNGDREEWQADCLLQASLRLANLAMFQPQGCWRVRLTLGPDGDIELTHAPLDANPAEPPPLLLASALGYPALASGNPLLRHKTTARATYDAALHEAMAAGAFDALFLNERGEVCEGARSNIFIRRNGRLLTPPLASGLLPGVLRAELLARGEAETAVLTLADLRAAEAVYCGNALRGLVQVRLSTLAE